MAQLKILASLLSLSFLVSACDEESEESPEAVDATGGEASTDDGSEPTEEPGTAPDDALTLEPSLLIDLSSLNSTAIDQLALSPSGDQVVVQWRDMDGAAQLTIFDTNDGSELINAPTEREGELYWLSDSEIVIVGFGGIFNFDASTLVEAELTAVDPPSCGRSTVGYFDRAAGIHYGAFENTKVCRLDLRTGDVATYDGENRVGVVAPEVGGDEIYLSEVDDDDTFFAVTLDATTMIESARESGERPAVLAATQESIITLQESGLGYALQPANVELPSGIVVGAPSYSGEHYGLWKFGDVVLLDSASGESVGVIEDTSANNGQNIFDWSNDDTVVAVFTADFDVAIYQLD